MNLLNFEMPKGIAVDKKTQTKTYARMDIRPLAWAFMFEAERCFEGTRTFSTQGIDKAVFNLFKLFKILKLNMDSC